MSEGYVRITADRERCCGAGNCVLTAPAVFDQDDTDGLVVLRRPTPPTGDVERVRQAADLCPSGAIVVSETSTDLPAAPADLAGPP